MTVFKQYKFQNILNTCPYIFIRNQIDKIQIFYKIVEENYTNYTFIR